MKLFMVLLGAIPGGRNTEQHDVFFGIAENLFALKKDLVDFWPEASDSLHIDASREVNVVDGFKVSVVPAGDVSPSETKLFFLNLGGYREKEFDEFHFKMLVAAKDKGAAIKKAKETVFYKHYNVKGAESHIDEKYGIDVDDVYLIEDILTEKYKKEYQVILEPNPGYFEDTINLGYLLLSKIIN
jgi:hypothetical protein